LISGIAPDATVIHLACNNRECDEFERGFEIGVSAACKLVQMKGAPKAAEKAFFALTREKLN